ncbi:glycosyltransferase family 4 protein [Fischerella sp. PCC 9605]|uniref:glycosyltransferase family 4 protein n=1 Tax=Fischerella sp. PCC 9605 TaxID=1173024 RepID=UPI0009E336A8|nr:glycosyltransferase family 4 protein [Fischerella sp. PCC 9605]
MVKTVANVIVTHHWADPRDPITWSGTPSNIIRRLEKLGVNIISISTGFNKYQKKFLELIHRMDGLGTDYFGGPVFRKKSCEILQRKVRHLECNKILHMGQFNLPVSGFPGFEHYLLMDATSYTWHQYETKLSTRNTDKGRKVHEQLDIHAFNHVKHFFSFSEYVKDSLINHYNINPDRITVVGSGIGNLQPFYGEKDYSNGQILFVASNRFEDKGGLLLLEGFKLAQKKNPEIKLVIVGQENKKYLNGSIPNLTVYGEIRGKQLQDLFNQAALFAMPSLNEPWGFVYLEALACKTPVLGLNRNALPEITQNGRYGFLVDEPTPTAIADAICHAFSHPDKLRTMGKEGQKHCLEKFSWEKTTIKIADMMLGIP